MATFGIIVELIVLIFIGGSGACDTDSMSGCFAGFSEYQKISSAVFVEYTEAQLQDVCRLFSKAETCMEQARIGCPSPAPTAWSSIPNKMQYLCSKEGRAGYLKHADCWSNTAVQRQGQSCNSTLHISLNEMTSSYKNGGYGTISQEHYADLCRATTLFFKCIYGSVKSTCGVEAADWQFKLDEQDLRKSQSLLQCKIDKTNGADTLSGGSTFLWILASLLIYRWSHPSI